jgi:hypothetical protein
MDHVGDMSQEVPDCQLQHKIIKIFPDQEDSEKMYILVEKRAPNMLGLMKDTGEICLMVLKGS